MLTLLARFRFGRLAALLVSGACVIACSSSPAATAADGGVNPATPGEDAGPEERTTDAATEIVVGVDANGFESQGFPIGMLEIIAKVEGIEVAHEKIENGSVPIFPHELRLQPPKDRPDASLELELVLRDRADASVPPVLRRRATTRFVKGTSKLAYVILEVRCNTFGLLGAGGVSGPTCAEGTTCVGGSCVSPELPPLSDYRADWAKNPPSACGEGSPELTIGAGESALAPLEDGATVTLEQGLQCGHHMWLALRMKNLSQSGTTTVVTATQPGTGLSVPATAVPFAWSPSPGGACDLVGLRFQLDTAAKVAEFLGKPLDIAVEAKDKAGRTATAVRHVNIATEFKPSGRDCSFARK